MEPFWKLKSAQCLSQKKKIRHCGTRLKYNVKNKENMP